MPASKPAQGASQVQVSLDVVRTLPLWQLDIVEVTGRNLEVRGREEVNRLLASGWQLLHIYTLKYQEDGVWRERPMAILGRAKDAPPETSQRKPRSPSRTESALPTLRSTLRFPSPS